MTQSVVITPTLVGERLRLDPLTVADAEEMVAVLADPGLYRFIGGQPPELERLRDRYAQLVAGSGDPAEEWHNWIVRVSGAVGTVQATVRPQSRAADLAWVVGAPWQGRGYAVEATRVLIGWLAGRGIVELGADIHPGHGASQGVARRVGMEPTDAFDADGEQRWRLAPSATPRAAPSATPRAAPSATPSGMLSEPDRLSGT